MSDREKFESWFDKEYLSNEDRRKNYRLSTVKELMLASWNAAHAQPRPASLSDEQIAVTASKFYGSQITHQEMAFARAIESAILAQSGK